MLMGLHIIEVGEIMRDMDKGNSNQLMIKNKIVDKCEKYPLIIEMIYLIYSYLF